MRYSVALHAGPSTPPALNGFTVWNVLVLFLMTAAYALPIAQFLVTKPPQAVVHHADR
jgi:hypothetical protein